MNKSESIKELATALAKAQAQIENASKNAVNPHLRSKYADLAEVLNTVRPVLAENGISIVQMPSYEGGMVSVETMLMHLSGEWISSTISAPVNKQDAQGVGSATSYCRRYALAAMCGIAQEDDDGSAVSGGGNKRAAKKAAEPNPELIEKINTTQSMDELVQLWGTIPADQKVLLAKCKDQRKQYLAKQQEAVA